MELNDSTFKIITGSKLNRKKQGVRLYMKEKARQTTVLTKLEHELEIKITKFRTKNTDHDKPVGKHLSPDLHI